MADFISHPFSDDPFRFLNETSDALAAAPVMIPETLLKMWERRGEHLKDNKQNQCGQVISDASRGTYAKKDQWMSASKIINRPELKLRIDQVKPGTLVYWKTKSIEQHFGLVTKIDANGIHVLESTKHGSKFGQRRIRYDQTVAEISKHHGVQPEFFRFPPGQKMVAAPASMGFGEVQPLPSALEALVHPPVQQWSSLPSLSRVSFNPGYTEHEIKPQSHQPGRRSVAAEYQSSDLAHGQPSPAAVQMAIAHKSAPISGGPGVSPG